MTRRNAKHLKLKSAKMFGKRIADADVAQVPELPYGDALRAITSTSSGRLLLALTILMNLDMSPSAQRSVEAVRVLPAGKRPQSQSRL